MSRASLVLACLLAGACTDSRRIEIVPLGKCATQAVSALAVSALGDFAPSAKTTTALSSPESIEFQLPRGTRALELEGTLQGALVAIGRSTTLDRIGLGARVPVTYAPPDTMCETGELNHARALHVAERLSTGQVLLAGGVGTDDLPVTTLELYLPLGDELSQPGEFRVLQGAATLDERQALGVQVAEALGARVALVTGGAPTRQGLADGIASEAYLALTLDGVARGPARVMPGGPRAFHAAVALRDGRVVVLGGCAELELGECAQGRLLSSSAIYVPGIDAFVEGPELAVARYGHRAFERADGTIAVVGGMTDSGDATIEIFDPNEQRSFVVDGSGPGVEGLAGRLITAGGERVDSDNVALVTASGTTRLASLPSARRGAKLLALDDGAVLVAGGRAQDRAVEELVLIDGRGGVSRIPQTFVRTGSAWTRLDDGTLLVTGGREGPATQAGARLFVHSLIHSLSNVPARNLADAQSVSLWLDPARTRSAAGRLHLEGTASDGLPRGIVLGSAMTAIRGTVSLLLGRDVEATRAAIIFGYESAAHFDFITLAVGERPRVFSVRSENTGRVMVEAQAQCDADGVSVAIADAELPMEGVAGYELTLGTLEVILRVEGRLVMACSPERARARGMVGVGVLEGAVSASTIGLTR